MHAVIDAGKVQWKIKVILHALSDDGRFTSLVCQMPGCRLSGKLMVLDNSSPRLPHSLSLDHVVCHHDGGPDRLSNLRPVHLRCQVLNMPENWPEIRSKAEAKRFALREYTTQWVECSCGDGHTWGAGYRRHIGRIPRDDHFPVRYCERTRRAGAVVREVDMPMPQLPAGRPGWSYVEWDNEARVWMHKDHQPPG